MLSKKLNTNYTFFNKNVDNSWDGYVLVFVGQEKMVSLKRGDILFLTANDNLAQDNQGFFGVKLIPQ